MEIVWWEHHGMVRVDVRGPDGKWVTKYSGLKEAKRSWSPPKMKILPCESGVSPLSLININNLKCIFMVKGRSDQSQWQKQLKAMERSINITRLQRCYIQERNHRNAIAANRSG